MKPKSSALLVSLSASATMLLVPAVASAAQLTGTVVQRSAATHSFVIADGGGRLLEIHASSQPLVGRRVVLTARQLRNGTWAARSVRQEQVSTRSRIRGTVTYSSAKKQMFVVSARGVSLLVRRHSSGRPARLLGLSAAAAPGVPAVGTQVTVSADLAGGEVSATQVTDQGTNTNGIDLEGVVLAIDTNANTISISADDSEQSSAALTVQVPPSFAISQFQVGGKVELVASLNPDGTYTLEQSSGDGSAQQANSSSDQQGSTSSDSQPSGAQQCAAQQADPNFPAAHNGQTFDQYYSINPSEPGNAFGDCVDALSADGGGQAGPQMQCLAQRSDPGFPAAHAGETFLQYYSPNPSEINPGDAFGHCVDLLHQQADSQPSGSGASGAGTSGAGSGD